MVRRWSLTGHFLILYYPVQQVTVAVTGRTAMHAWRTDLAAGSLTRAELQLPYAHQVSFLGDAKRSLGDAKSSVTLRARWVTLRARWVTLRARWVTLRARWVR
jgi:hypothetical protein